MFNHLALPRRAAAVRRQLDQLGAHRRADRLLLHRRRGARRAASAGVLRGADRQFRRHARRLRRQAHGPADRAADHRHQRQRHPGPHARDRRLRDRAACSRPPRPRWTSRSRRISSACCSRRMAAMPRPSARLMAGLSQSRSLHDRGRSRSRAIRARVRRRRGRRGRRRRRDARAPTRDAAMLLDPHTRRRRHAGARARSTSDPRRRWSRSATAHPAKFPDAVERGDGRAAGPAAASRRPDGPAGALHRAAQRPGRGRALHPRARPRRRSGAA